MKDYGLKTRTRLRLDAIPTLIKGVPEETPCGERAAKRASKKLVQELLQSSEEEEEAIPEPAPPCFESAAQLGKLKSKISEFVGIGFFKRQTTQSRKIQRLNIQIQPFWIRERILNGQSHVVLTKLSNHRSIFKLHH